LKLLTVLLRHNLQNHRRKRTRRRAAGFTLQAEVGAPGETESSEAIIERAEELARVRGCILRMGGLQRRVIMLSLLDERPREEVAAVLGISDGYVRVLLHRAREHVRDCHHDDPPSLD
jgi:RNA polymerase sigma-70 factor (ECF subfamily)